MKRYESEKAYIGQVCSRCVNRSSKEDLCEIHRTINGTYRCPNEELLTERYLCESLLKLGFNPSSRGFKYWQEAVLLYKMQKNETLKITKIYNQIADKYNTTASAVERCMGVASLPAKSKILNKNCTVPITNYRHNANC